jgi:hypothetical protein
MHKLRNEMMNLKIMINSSYGMSGVSLSLYDEMLKKKNKFFKIQNRFLKVKRLFDDNK